MKSLLWQKRFGFADFNNYEGMSLGPVLTDGSRSLLLISDDNTTPLMEQTLYALKIKGVQAVPEPATAIAILTGLVSLFAFIKRSRA